ncbi:MAG: GNAT family N-acetyltransferase [Elusimicrobia bacterium]|nr:GNAT family N-acetyltransferase [Elusimicrobiota bacterium]
MDIAQLKLRPATDQDRDAIIRLISDALQEYGLPLYLDTMDSDLSDIRGSYEAAGGFFDVLEGAQGEIAGCVGLRPAAGPACELRRMYLKASWRGKGLGKRLLKHTVERAKALGFSRIRLETASVLKEAIGLYTSCGFRPQEHADLSKCCDRAYVMEL